MIKIVLKEPVPHAYYPGEGEGGSFARTMQTLQFPITMQEFVAKVNLSDDIFADTLFMLHDATGREFLVPGDNIAWVETVNESRQAAKVS